MFPAGHIGGALLVSAPTTRVLGPRQSLWFTACAVFGSRLPDVDTVLPLPHHGVTHTLAFVLAFSVGLGVATFVVAEAYVPAEVASVELRLPPRTLLALTAGGLFVGGGSHVVLDILSVGTGTTPKLLHPLWPLRSNRVGYAIIPVRAAYTNLGLLAAGAAVYVWGYVTVPDTAPVRTVRRWVDR